MCSESEREESSMTLRFLTFKYKKELSITEVEKPMGGTVWKVYANSSVFTLNVRIPSGDIKYRV